MPLTVPPGLTSPLSADLDFNSHKGTNVTDPTSPQDEATKNYVDQAISAISQNSGSGVISGCGVAWSGTGLVFNVSAGTYSINGTTYTLAAQQVTLAAADPSNPRIDLIIANTSSVADKITGTASQNPVAPSVDPATQLQLTFVYVPAGATTPNVTNTLLYDENVGAATEWNTSSSGSTWALGSTNNPNTGSKDIEATSVGTNAYVQLQKGIGTVDPSTVNSLVFWIRSKATWANNRSITISLLNAGTQYGNGVSLRDGVLGFSSSNTSGYQQIVVPISSFNVNANPVNQVRFTVAGSGGSIGFYLDTINLQAGINNSTQNFVVWRGDWVSTASYVRNDSVKRNSVFYVALAANTNSEPTLTNANWQATEGFPGIPTTYSSSFTVPQASYWPILNYITLSSNIYATIPSGSFMVCGNTSSTIQESISADNVDITMTGTYATVASKAFTLAIGDTLIVDVYGTILNASTGAATYSFQVNVGAVAIFDHQGGTNLAAQASNRYPHVLRYVISISATNSWRAVGNFIQASTVVAANTLQGIGAQSIWNTGTNDLTGAQTVSFKMKSSGNAANQTFSLYSYEIQRKPRST